MARAVDAAVEWVLAPVLYCCVLADSAKLSALRWPSPEIFSTVIVSLMLDLLVCMTSLAGRLAGFGRVPTKRQHPSRSPHGGSKVEPIQE